jgi:hypothetical protein
VLRAKRGLITDGMFARCRYFNPKIQNTQIRILLQEPELPW